MSHPMMTTGQSSQMKNAAIVMSSMTSPTPQRTPA
jgi:hypothetical protein